MTLYTLFGQPATPATLTADAQPYTFGVEFSVSVGGATLAGMWFYSAPSAAALPGTIALYAISGTSLVHSETPTWSGAAASGWVHAPFSSPPSLTASTAYKACVLQSSGVNWYSVTANYWSSGAGSGGITNGPLSAPNNAGSTGGGQDTFTNSGTLAYPSSTFNSGNYWVDPEVSATVASATGLLIAGEI